jgi:putative ABC transport system permease protein
MLKAMLRDLHAHKGRIAMTLVAIVLGAAFVVATWVIADSTAASVTASGARSDVDVAVRGPEDHPMLTNDDVRRLEEIPGVEDTTAVHAAPASLIGARGKIIPGRHLRAGTGWDDTGRFALTTGRAPRQGEVALSATAATESGLGQGDSARVILADGQDVHARIAGVFDYRTLGVEPAPEVAFAAADASALLGDHYDRIELRTTSGTAVIEAVRRTMTAPGLTVSTGGQLAAESRDDATAAADSTRESLLAFAAVALLVGMFVIANTFTMLVTQRVRHYALLRAVGASRRQVRRTVLLEAATLGFVGATVGVAVGIALGLLGMWAFTSPGDPVTYSVTPVAVAIGYVVGVGVTAVAAWASSRRAAAVAPVAALRTDAGPVAGRGAGPRTVAGTALLLTGVVGVAVISGDGLSTTERVLCLAAGVVGWLGVLLLAPVLAAVVLRPLARIAGRRGGPVLRLATRNAVRDPRRTAATSSALLVGLALVCAFATLGETMVSMSGAAVRATVPADATILRSASGSDPLGADVLDRARATPGVERVAADRYALVGVTHDGGAGRTSVSAIEPDGFGGVLTPKIVEGSGDLRRGVVVGTNEAAMLGVGIGDRVAFEFPGAPPVRQEIVGLIDTVEGQPLFYLDVGQAPEWFRDRITTVYATGDNARAALDTAFRDRPDVVVTDRETVLADEMAEFQLLLAVMYAMFGAAIVIAVFGVINTLALSVTERTREIGVLRAVGATRRLVRRSVRFESVVICGYGGVLGIVVGLLFGAVMQHVMLGNPLFDVGVPYLVILISLAGMVLVGVLSAMWPARRAARTDVLDAIRTD